MSGPEPGQYHIIPVTVSADPNIGVENNTDVYIAQVILGGSDNVFTVGPPVNGQYTLALDMTKPPRHIAAGDQKVVGIITTGPIEDFWNISGPKGGPYVILEPNSSSKNVATCWAVEGQEIHLKTYELGPVSVELPTWKFIPVEN